MERRGGDTPSCFHCGVSIYYSSLGFRIKCWEKKVGEWRVISLGVFEIEYWGLRRVGMEELPSGGGEGVEGV